MCYALPGPRCSGHCGNDLKKARVVYFTAVEKIGGDEKSRAEFTAAKERYDRAQARFDRSPEGQRLLREEAASIRSVDPERAAALEGLADEGAKAHTYEVGAHKKKSVHEQQQYERLHDEAMRTGAQAEKIADRLAAGAPDAERDALEALQAKVRTLTAQYSTTPMGLQRIRAGIERTRSRLAVAETEEQRSALARGLKAQVEHYKESKSKRAHMLAEFSAAKRVREMADTAMAEARATGGFLSQASRAPRRKSSATTPPHEQD